jgi:hypothetical protein
LRNKFASPTGTSSLFLAWLASNIVRSANYLPSSSGFSGLTAMPRTFCLSRRAT